MRMNGKTSRANCNILNDDRDTGNAAFLIHSQSPVLSNLAVPTSLRLEIINPRPRLDAAGSDYRFLYKLLLKFFIKISQTISIPEFFKEYTLINNIKLSGLGMRQLTGNV